MTEAPVAGSSTHTAHTALRICPFCEATCGLTLTIDAGQVTAARGDRDDVFSAGFICPKGASFGELDNDPDRLTRPLVRRDGVLTEATWDEAYAVVAERLGVSSGDTVTVGGQNLTAAVDGSGQSVWVSSALASTIVGDRGWYTVWAPAGQEKRRDLGATFGAASDLPATYDPSVVPDPAGRGLVYDLVGGSGPLTFEQNYSALFSGKVTSSTLGLISIIGLVLGFVIALSSFLAAVAERKREFGIMSSIGLADEVLYFFLVESGIVFVVAYLVGVLGAGAAVALTIPSIATPTAWLQAAAMVAAFLPAMAIVGALVPVHRLLQQRPVDLLGDR